MELFLLEIIKILCMALALICAAIALPRLLILCQQAATHRSPKNAGTDTPGGNSPAAWGSQSHSKGR